MSDIRFGSDGWRGTIAGEFTFDNVRRAAQGVAEFVGRDPAAAGRPMVIGYDHRFASEAFAAVAAEVLAGHGMRVLLIPEATPTPVISFSVVSQGAAGAIIITASHNPPADNGFKIRDRHGVAVAPEGLKEIERLVPASAEGVKRIPLERARRQGLVESFYPAPAYDEYLQRQVDLDRIRRAGLAVVHDAMWGAGAGWLERLLAGGSTTVDGIRQERNPAFPGMRQPEPIPPNIDALLARVAQRGADVGIANDGDADRIGMADERGRFVTQLQVAGLLALYLLRVRGQRGAIVKTLSSTVMLNILGRQAGLEVYDTAIGPKHVGPKVAETDAMLGATESGGFFFRGLTERDGILGALYLLDLMVQTEKRPAELLAWLYETVGARYQYRRIDTPFPPERREEIWERVRDARPEAAAGLAVTGRDTIDPNGFRFHLADGGWLLIRFSGTEPIVRVYCETADEARIDPLLAAGLQMAGLSETPVGGQA